VKRSIGIASLAGLSAIATFSFIQWSGSNGSNVDAKKAANAAFRDGAFQARLAAERGDDPHVSVGRWSNAADRKAYVAGYQQTYLEAQRKHEGLTVAQGTTPKLDESNSAYRDGEFQARLAAENGQKPHLSSGRWSKDTDRRAYVAGYQQAYLQALGEDGITVPQGIEQAGYRDGLEAGAQDRQNDQAPRLSGLTLDGNEAYREAYSTGYQLAYYGEQQVQNALVIRPVVSR